MLVNEIYELSLKWNCSLTGMKWSNFSSWPAWHQDQDFFVNKFQNLFINSFHFISVFSSFWRCDYRFGIDMSRILLFSFEMSPGCHKTHVSSHELILQGEKVYWHSEKEKETQVLHTLALAIYTFIMRGR